MSDDGTLNAHQVAEAMGWGYRKALRLIGDEIPGYFDGYRWMTTTRDLESWKSANTVTGRHGKQRRRGRGRRAA